MAKRIDIPPQKKTVEKQTARLKSDGIIKLMRSDKGGIGSIQ